jgi:hypothetical protein
MLTKAASPYLMQFGVSSIITPVLLSILATISSNLQAI